jgi:hypothetical protein
MTAGSMGNHAVRVELMLLCINRAVIQVPLTRYPMIASVEKSVAIVSLFLLSNDGISAIG